MGKKGDTEIRLPRVAARQHGVVTIRQFVELGISQATVTRWTQRGRLHRIHQGVYAVGHRGLEKEGRWMAAGLACGDGAVLSHASAAVLLTFLLPMGGPIDVSVPTSAGRKRRQGIRIHRTATLAGSQTVRRLGIPVTNAERTVAVLPQVLEPRLVRRARPQAQLFGGLGRPAEDNVRSDLEGDFLGFCRRHGLPAPLVNAQIGEWTVDFVWPEQRVAVETDDLAYHRGDVSFEHDHELELDLQLAGYEFRRVTGKQIAANPEKVIRTLHEALGSVRSRR